MWGWYYKLVSYFAHEPMPPIQSGVLKTSPVLITPDQLQKITDHLPIPHLVQIADLLNELCPKYGITDKGVFQMFLANILQESNEFRHKEENMNYSAGRLLVVWPARFKTFADTVPYRHNPEKLSNLVYGGRMGNYLPSDGFTFKGAGFIGITGRELYTKYAKYLGKDLSLTAGLMKSDDRYALDSACWFFAVYRELIPVAMTGNFKEVCKRINGGLTGYDVRVKYWERTKIYL